MKTGSSWRSFLDGFKRGHAGRGEFFDLCTYAGNIRSFLFSCIVMWVLWHADDLVAWGHEALGIAYQIDRAKQRWAELWALILGSMGMLTSVVAAVMISINRRRVRNSAKGQWYDRRDLTREDLTDDGSISDSAGNG